MKKMLMAIMCFTVANLAFSIELDMTGAVNMAYENNYEIKNAKKDLENYGLQVKEAYKSGLPTLSYSGSYSMLENQTEIANPDSDKTVSQSISLTQPICMGGQAITGITASQKAKEMAEYTYTQKKKDVKLEVEKQYIGILKLQRQKEIIETSLKKLKEDFIKVGVLYDLSIVSKSSVLDLDYSITQIETSLIEVENGIEISKLQLKNMIGISASEEINLKDVQVEGSYSKKASIEGDLNFARENNLNIKKLKIGSQLQKDSEVITRAALMPNVAFVFDYGAKNKTSLDDTLKSENLNWTATLAVNYDIWSWGKNVNKFERAKNETSKVIESEKNSVNNIEIGIRNSYLTLIRYDKIMESKNKSYISAKENYEIYKEKLDAGIISTTDFLEAESNLRTSEIEYRNTELEYYLAYIEYNYLLNREE